LFSAPDREKWLNAGFAHDYEYWYDAVGNRAAERGLLFFRSHFRSHAPLTFLWICGTL